MKFKLPRSILSPEMSRIVTREIKRLKVNILRPTNKHLKEISKVTQEIAKSGLPKHLVCKNLPHDLGHGIFLHPNSKPIKRGEVIAPYAGEALLVAQNEPDDSAYAFAPLLDMLLTKNEQTYYDEEHRFHPKRLYSLLVDAVDKGNFTRFINHSDKPNVYAELIKVSSNSYGLAPSPLDIIYIAKKTINPGEQLLVSYEGEEDSYWAVFGIKPFPMTPKTFQLDSSLNVVQKSKKVLG